MDKNTTPSSVNTTDQDIRNATITDQPGYTQDTTSLSPTSGDEHPPATPNASHVKARAMSISNMTKAELLAVINSTTKFVNTTEPMKLDVDRLHSHLATQYGKKAEKVRILEAVLHFFSRKLDICPHDTITKLKAWGQPPLTSLAPALEAHCKVHFSDIDKKQWGKTLSTIFGYLTEMIWPRTHQHHVKPKRKHRCLYGIRLRHTVSGQGKDLSITTTCSPEEDPSSTRKRKIDDTTPTSVKALSPFILPPQQVLPKRSTTSPFTPYHDILLNDSIYVVRCILPLMATETAEKLKIKINLLHRKISITGNYLPSNLIGRESSKQILPTQPLLPTIPSGIHTTGYFELDISVPTDIRTDLSNVKLIHDCWGLCFSFPRVKIQHDCDVQLTSCFGVTPTIGNARKGKSTPPVEMSVPKRTNSTAAPPDTEAKAPITPVDIADPSRLINMSVSVDGKLWGNAWAGKTYKGIIVKCEDLLKTEGYVRWTIQFEDICTPFELDDLLNENVITQTEHDALKPSCYDEEVLKMKRKKKANAPKQSSKKKAKRTSRRNHQ